MSQANYTRYQLYVGKFLTYIHMYSKNLCEVDIWLLPAGAAPLPQDGHVLPRRRAPQEGARQNSR